MLTEIGRALHEKIPIIRTVTRPSRMASSKHFDDERLRKNFVAEVAPLTKRELPVVAVNLTDLAKPCAEAMWDPCQVRDASSRRSREEDDAKRRGGSGRKPAAGGAAKNPKESKGARRRRAKKAEVVPDCRVFEAVATAVDTHILVPPRTEVLSTVTPGFKSQNDGIEHWLRYLARSGSVTAPWLFDQGLDGGYILKVPCDPNLGLRWVVRMVGTRNVEFQEESRKMGALAADLDLPHTTVVSTRGKGSRDRLHSVRFGFLLVHIKDIPEQRGLVVAHMGGSRRNLLLCWKLPSKAMVAAPLIRACPRRWGAKDSERALTELRGAEDVRVRSIQALARLVRLAAMALAGLCLLLAPATAEKITARAKTVGMEPLLLVCRMAKGLRPVR